MSLDNTGETAHTAAMNTMPSATENQPLSLTRRMQGLSKEERRGVMATAAETLAGYYRTDPEIQEWQALDEVDFYNTDDGADQS